MRPVPVQPGPGQESVWSYPRPPRLEPVAARVTVSFGGRLLADTTSAWRVLETSHPPQYYLPPDDVDMSLLQANTQRSFCEWKGSAHYWDVVAGDTASVASAWSYPFPSEHFGPITDHLAFYCARMDRCTVDGEVAVAQPGGFYGGWVTSNIVGPFKGEPGTMGW